MKLAGQLLAVSAVTLLLPWAGCQYARDVESALRDGERQAIISSAQLLAAALAPSARAYATDAERWKADRPRAADVYVHSLGTTPVLDGFVEDWGAAAGFVEQVDGLLMLAGRRGAFVHVFAIAVGNRPPAALQVAGRVAVVEFPLEAPGAVTATIHGTRDDPRARGYWQATSQGWQLEARVPATLLDDRLGLRLLEADGTPRATSFGDAPGWMTGPDPAAQSALDALAPSGQRVYLADRAGFVLAAQGPDRPAGPGRGPDWMERFYRAVLGGRLESDRPPPARPGQLSGRHIELAALGTNDARRYATAGGGLLAAAAPVGAARAPAAIVVVERDTAGILSLTREPTRRLLSTSLAASLVVAAVLLGFAALLSFRIRRLRDAAATTVGQRGEIGQRLPGTRAGDELGDLARRFDALLHNVREHNLYLQSLGGRLAHELRTPLAVVRSSLDNLEAEHAPSGPWLARARGGVDRMSALVNALSAAQRIERAVAAAETEHFDLAAQVSEMVEAYRTLHPGRTFLYERPARACAVHGAPELIAQMLDKLVENAVEFSPPGGTIGITLGAEGTLWRLGVANTGSGLPPGPPERLFDSLVSERPSDRESHLGLGLFIVRLVAEFHRGRASAANLPGDEGVEFVVELPQARDAPGAS